MKDGGQAAFPMVLWADMAGRVPQQGAQHADAGLESSYARLAGLKVVADVAPQGEVLGLGPAGGVVRPLALVAVGEEEH